MLTEELKKRIDDLLGSKEVILFMKGTRDFPMCGFSARAVTILDELKTPFNTFNILEDEEIRQGLKEYSEWPTFPQLYVKKQLIGGSDIMMEMYETGELQNILKS